MSANGTLWNGETILKHRIVILSNMDSLQIGKQGIVDCFAFIKKNNEIHAVFIYTHHSLAGEFPVGSQAPAMQTTFPDFDIQGYTITCRSIGS